MSHIKMIARITGVVHDEPSVGDPLSYKVYYEFSEPIQTATGGWITNGGVYLPVEALTESEVVANVQERVVTHANQQTEWLFQFSLDDVRGGWF